jgi:hypothetical protein
VTGRHREQAEEQPLHGGNTGVVVRAGDTVRRQAGHWTPAVHALLDHLESVGFDAAPRALGTDGLGREVASYLPGVAGTLGPHVLDPRFRSVAACGAIGTWLRRFHDAQTGFVPDPALPWRVVPGRALRPGEVIVHHDVGTYNTVLRPDGSFAVIDFDFAAPGQPVEDLANVQWSWTPLWHDEAAVRREMGGAPLSERLHKFAAVLDGYAADASLRAQVADAVLRCMLDHSRTLEDLAAGGDPAFERMVADGHAERPRLDATWFAAHRALFEAAAG